MNSRTYSSIHQIYNNDSRRRNSMAKSPLLSSVATYRPHSGMASSMSKRKEQLGNKSNELEQCGEL